jgi:DNA-binding NtrC family response regulator
LKRSRYPSFSVLLVDDELPWLRSLSMALSGEGGITNIIQCQDSRQVMDILGQQDVGLVLLDLTMPHCSGEALLARIAETFPSVLVIIITGLNQVEGAVSCMKVGAFDYYVKTHDKDRIVTGILHAVRMIELERQSRDMQSRLLADRLEMPNAFADLITISKKMFVIFQYVEAIAVSKQPVLITGESGVGKELIARALHNACLHDAAMISVNMAGLDDNMFTDTLFGHARGAFTGAEEARRGLVEQAGSGTLFLDEIGDLSLASQVKLLRLLQDGEYYPIGSDTVKRTKARIVLATNQDLQKKQQLGEFRRDLYYRLQTHQIHMPPLRERKEDIPLLLNHFVEQAAREFGRDTPDIPKQISALLARYDFPGNVRELRSMTFDEVSRSKASLSVDGFRNMISLRQANELHPEVDSSGEDAILKSFLSVQRLPTYEEVEVILTDAALRRAEGNQTLAARMLGISQPGLSKRLRIRKRDLLQE